MDKAQSSKIKAQRVFKNVVLGNIHASGNDWRATIVGGITVVACLADPCEAESLSMFK